MALFLLLACWSLCTTWLPSVRAQEPPTAKLDYGTFAGAYSANFNISYWQKIPFAAPPIGKNRFRAPQPPAPITGGTYDSAKLFDACPNRKHNFGSEDCLYLGLFGRPWTAGQPLRPVVVNFFGGGFDQGGATFNLPPAGYPVLDVSDTNNLLFVHPNYRTNAFGFLPGKQIAEDPESDLNPGLLDQQAALQWTQKYIEHFGGDPKNVSIWGQSAGAGSVVAHLIANGGNTQPKLFSKALTSSPFWPKTYAFDAPQAQEIYDRLAKLTNCTGPDSLQCLKTVDVQTLRTAAARLVGIHQTSSSSTWAPVIDHQFLTQPLSQAIAKGQVNSDYGFGTYNANEGENFLPSALQNDTSIESFERWLKGYLPDFSPQNLQKVKQLYPLPESTDGRAYSATNLSAASIYRDSVLACPALWTARAARKKSYLSQYTISPAKHGADTKWFNRVNAVQETNRLVYEGFTGAFASFFQTGDPNAHKLTDQSVAEVPESKLTNEEFVIEAGGFRTAPIKELQEKCQFWLSAAREIPI